MSNRIVSTFVPYISYSSGLNVFQVPAERKAVAVSRQASRKYYNLKNHFFIGYSIWLTSIDDSPLDIESLKTSCQNSTNLKFDTSQTWTNLYDQIILAQKNNQWNFVCGINNESYIFECAHPDTKEFFEVVKIADLLSLFVIGEENEIYYIPKYGKPHNQLDFELAKLVYKKYGLDIKKIIEHSAL